MTKYKLLETHWGTNNAVNSATERFWDTSDHKPYVHPKFLSTSVWRFENYDINPPTPSGALDSVYQFPVVVDQSDIDHMTNKSYEKFTNGVRDTAQGANNLLEMQGNFDTIAKHAVALTSAYKAVRKGDISGALRKLGVTGVSSRKIGAIKKRSKQAADIWLELHFGWVPLVQDIGTSIGAIQRIDLGARRFKSSSSTNFTHPDSYVDIIGSVTEHVVRNYGQGKVTVKMVANYRMSNPNALLANQLGFVNPLSVAWEAVPFSFVVDWFSNVGQVLGACTDFVGLSLEDSYTTTFSAGTRFDFLSIEDSADSSNNSSRNVLVQVISCRRRYGITGPTLSFKPFKGFSPTRGATAISLLLQTLKG